jgi:Tfp pilus assembly major pilin PilA
MSVCTKKITTRQIMKTFKVAEKLMTRPDAPERWSLDIDVKVKRAIVPAGTTGDLKLGYTAAHLRPDDPRLPTITWRDCTKGSRLPITPITRNDHQAITIDHKPITRNDHQAITIDHKPIICSECGRHCSQPGQTFEELRKVTPWWDMAALYRPDPCAPPKRPSLIPSPENFEPVEMIEDGNLVHICGQCDRRRQKAEKIRKKAAADAAKTGRVQLTLFEV